jgi:hypothetical protein
MRPKPLPQADVQFIPAHWLEFACWNRPMVVYSRPIPESAIPWLSSVPASENCKTPISAEKRTAA